MLSSIAVGAMAFLIAFPLVLLMGGMLLGPLETEAFLPPQLILLLAVSALIALFLAIFAGIKYYRFISKPK